MQKIDWACDCSKSNMLDQLNELSVPAVWVHVSQIKSVEIVIDRNNLYHWLDTAVDTLFNVWNDSLFLRANEWSERVRSR